MGFRFQKRIPIFPGVYLNLSKSGVSISLGGHGATVNLGGERKTVTLGIPGTGMSYKVPLTGAIVVGIMGLAVVAALIWFLAPDVIKPALHWWQPKIF
jgi:multisubunit Na+/H+ antiporter MnhB subunit